jgi:hypothetical protein
MNFQAKELDNTQESLFYLAINLVVGYKSSFV